MPTINQIKYLSLNRSEIKEPILIVGSKEYDFDAESFLNSLSGWGFSKILGIDLLGGIGVDRISDICEDNSTFVREHAGYFKTVICMQVLYAARNPFNAASNIMELLRPQGHLIFSDVFCHKVHRIPTDYWRFTYDAHKLLFDALQFDDRKACVGITRTGQLLPLSYPLPEILKYSRHPDETLIGSIVRRIHTKFLARGIFQSSRLLPEISLFSFATKINAQMGRS